MPELRFGKAQLCPWLCPMLLAWHWTDHFCFRTRQTWAYWKKSNKEPPRCWRAWSTSPLRRRWESWGCSAWGEEAQGGAHPHPQTPEGRAQRTEMGTWGWAPCSGYPCWSGAGMGGPGGPSPPQPVWDSLIPSGLFLPPIFWCKVSQNVEGMSVHKAIPKILIPRVVLLQKNILRSKNARKHFFRPLTPHPVWPHAVCTIHQLFLVARK